jgi:hypothetical protein
MPRPSRADPVRDGMTADPAQYSLLTRDDMILPLDQRKELPLSTIGHAGSVSLLYDIL